MPVPPVRSFEIVPYWSSLRAADDISPVGGPIDRTYRVLFTDLTPVAVLELVSTYPFDTTQTCTLTVLQSTGLLTQQTISLQGLLPVTFDSLGSVDRVEELKLSSVATGTITLRQSSNLATVARIPPGELGFRRMFLQASPSATLPKSYYEKFFWYNGSATTDITSAVVKLVADPSTEISHCLAAQINDSAQIPNRITVPTPSILAAPAIFDDVTQNVPTGTVAHGSAVGVWVALTLAPSPLPLRSSFTSQLLGATPS